MKTFQIFVILISVMLIILPLQESYAVCTTYPNDYFPNPHLREQIVIPKIGFFTVGDDVPVTFTITNNYTETKYLKVSEVFRPYQNADKSNVETYDNNTVAIDPNSTISFQNSFIAMFPDLWTLIVSANGFDNYTREGVTNPCYQNFTKFYVHPSSDQDIRLLAQSTNANANSVANEFNVITITAIATTILAGATGVLAVFGFRQIRIMNRNVLDQERISRLAYGPLIWPRFRPNGIGGDPILRFENIGNGAATNVIIDLTLLDRVVTINRLAFSHHLSGTIDLNMRAGGFGVEFHPTDINLRINPEIPTRMRYRDINGDPYDISGTIIFENNEVRFERNT